MVGAITTRILRQILLVIVGTEAIYSTEFSDLSCRGQSTGRLSVDAAVDPSVDQEAVRLACRRSSTPFYLSRRAVSGMPLSVTRHWDGSAAADSSSLAVSNSEDRRARMLVAGRARAYGQG
jgi:hypothetical protein